MSSEPWATTREPYRELVRAMIEADGPCPSPTCRITMLGHLLANVPPRLVELVRAEDPTQQPTPEGPRSPA